MKIEGTTIYAFKSCGDVPWSCQCMSGLLSSPRFRIQANEYPSDSDDISSLKIMRLYPDVHRAILREFF